MIINNQNSIAEFDIREDEEQLLKREEICKLLLTAGYFRARIKGLSIFDKIVGGIVWCMQTCNVDIDVDLVFHEDSAIKQKIALTEQIVAVLAEMKCPQSLLPHQIQGLDAVHIFPAVQWLVKGAMEFRQQNEHKLKRYAVWVFNQSYQTPKDIKDAENFRKTCELYCSLEKDYHPKRVYKRRSDKPPPADRRSRVRSTLLEYDCTRLHSTDDNYESTDVSSAAAAAADSEANKIDVKRLMKSMTAVKSTDHGGISDFVKKQVLSKAALYINEELTVATGQPVQGHTTPGQHITLDKCHQLEKSITKETEIEQELLDDFNKVDDEGLSLDAAIASKKQSLKDWASKSQINQFEKMKSEEKRIENNFTDAKVNSQEIKEEYKQVIVDMVEKIDHLENNEEIKEHNDKLNQEILNVRAKILKNKLQLAKKNREIVGMERKVDEAPCQVELRQYQHRFRELSDTIQSKHTETKRFFTHYNTLIDQRSYLEKEVAALNSIYENYEQGMQTESSQREFLDQMKDMNVNISRTIDLLKNKQDKRTEINVTMTIEQCEHVNKLQVYTHLVKHFTKVCNKNEILAGKLKNMQT